MRVAGVIRVFLALAVSIAGVFGGFSESRGEDGKGIFAEKCARCHKISGPPAQTFEERKNRQGPDLTGAGSKFQKGWVEGWLQEPATIRPAGVMFLNHVKPGGKNDVVDQTTLPPHMALSAEEAKVVAQYLMTLTDQRVAHGMVEVGGKLTRFERNQGKSRFQKRFGCYACHQIKDRRGRIVGGLSGPQLYDAGRRLQADWVYAFIKDPQALDPKVWMPRREFTDKDLQILTKYIMSLK